MLMRNPRLLLTFPVWFFSRLVMACRYSFRVIGMEEVKKHPGPYLVLPNHPAYCDPPNLIVHLLPAFIFRPLLLETNFKNPLLAPFGWLLRAIKVPDVSEASADARERAKKAVENVIAALKDGDNVVLWPSGHLMRIGTEKIGGARAVSDILAAVPNVTVVLARSRGLWGSSFSWGYSGTKPKLMNRLFAGGGLLFANFFLLTPKRRGTITLEAFPTAGRPEPTREAINPWLEAWYNADVPREEPTFVPYHFLFGKRTHEFPPPKAMAETDFSEVKPATKQAIAEIVAEKLKRPLTDAENSGETTFSGLGIDSLETMEMTLEVERRFGFTGETMPLSLGQLWALAEGTVDKGPPKPPPEKWFSPPTGDMTVEVLGDTVAAALVNRAVKNRGDVAMADDLAGVLTYERVLLGATILAARFREFPEANVGLLLPASAAGTMSLFALHIAGKVPVILNWTTGPGNMEHGVKLAGVKRVVTSKKFVDRLHLEVPGAEFVFLENVRGTVGSFEKIRRLLALKLFPAAYGRAAISGLTTTPDHPAVVLFTSGSEKAPKAVPLTHANVLGDVRAFIPRVKVNRTDSGLIFLPLFHSFGHTVTGLFPLLLGARVVYHPDPTDATGLARKAATYKTTLTAATPTFLGYILDRAKPGDLDSMTKLVVGAEKCPDALFERAAAVAPNAVVMEGYGITECSPVVAVNPPDAVKRGTIGVPVVGLETKVVHVDTGEPLPAGEMGMLLVHGPMVFPGYLGHEGESPFRDLDGKHWYVTGDLAAVGDDGYLRFHGRLKRFLKVAGEMISLPALEEPFAKKYPPTDAGPRVAVEGIETPDGRKVVLFSTEEIALKDANGILSAAGFRGVMRLDEVRNVEAIPVLGTGKTDYKVLRAQI
jgi:long-chain-fatty-acid--[acyl-carrier-protein] ligase